MIDKVKSIMLTGINKFAKEFQVENTQAQIQVCFNEEGEIIYKKCNDFQPVSQVKFSEIMNRKFDALGYGIIIKPYLQKALLDFASELNTEPIKVSGFIYLHSNIVYIAIYNEKIFYKNHTLDHQFELLGLG